MRRQKRVMGRKTVIFAAAVAALILAGALFALLRGGDGGGEKPPLSGPLLMCLDPGHGGSDPGSLGPDGRQEKDDTLALALRVRALLEEREIEVAMTREEDAAVSLADRCALANASGAALLVSIHRNSGGGRGVEVWIKSEPERLEEKLAGRILKGLADAGISADRGVRKGSAGDPNEDYAMNGSTQLPSCLVELGFMDSGEDNALFDEHFEAYALALADGIEASLR